MAFTSFNFIVFVLVVFCTYFIIPKKWRWVVLLVASYAFYLLSSPKTLVYILFTTISTFFLGIVVGRLETRYKAHLAENKDTLGKFEKKELKVANQSRKRRVLLIAILLNFGILAFIKYFQIYFNAIGTLMGIQWLHFDTGILIPLGISFYTFQSMGYIIDVYRGKYAPDTNLAKFALFVSFFPQIIQGPISRYDQLAGQLYEGHAFNYTRIKMGIQLMLWGWFKKLVIADRVAFLVDEVFNNYTQYQGTAVILAVIGYTIQIYADFSGGMDIARGAAQIFGIDMVENFQRPYFATTIPDFWRRWHITLSIWCRDYIFYPLSLSKGFGKLGKQARKIFSVRIGKLIPVILAQLVTFLVIGLWHGAEARYLIYGFYHGAFIILGLIFEPYIKKLTALFRINTNALSWKIVQIIRTFILVVIGRFFSRAVSAGAAVYMMKSCLAFENVGWYDVSLYSLELSLSDFWVLGIALLLWFFVSVIQESGQSVRKVIAEQNLVFRWIIYLIAILAILFFGIYGIGYDASAFIYRGF